MSEGKILSGCGGVALPAGTALRPRYRITGPLGRGGFGITYVASDMKTGSSVAIKELYPQYDVQRMADGRTVSVTCGRSESFAHMRMRFEQEAETLILLQKKEGIVRLYHLFQENGTAYYVMELLKGEDMNRRLKRCGPMSWKEFSPILQTVLNALEQLHSAGMIHRDISPDNIFLTEDTGARLIDFGSVRCYGGDAHYTAIIKQAFAPWEQYLTNGEQGPWTDIYALSVTAYYTLSGVLPPPAPQRRLEDKAKPLNKLCPEVPTAVCEAIHKGMSVRIEDRFQSVSQMRDALTAEAGGSGSTGSTLCCLSGMFSGKSWMLPPGTALCLGRSPECGVEYPPKAPGISRRQCTFYRLPEGQTLVRDEHSSFGTFLLWGGTRQKMEPGKWYRAEGARVCFGQQEEYTIK